LTSEIGTGFLGLEGRLWRLILFFFPTLHQVFSRVFSFFLLEKTSCNLWFELISFFGKVFEVLSHSVGALEPRPPPARPTPRFSVLEAPRIGPPPSARTFLLRSFPFPEVPPLSTLSFGFSTTLFSPNEPGCYFGFYCLGEVPEIFLLRGNAGVLEFFDSYGKLEPSNAFSSAHLPPFSFKALRRKRPHPPPPY